MVGDLVVDPEKSKIVDEADNADDVIIDQDDVLEEEEEEV